MNSPLVLFVAAPRGLEELLAAELAALGLSATPARGGVNAQSDLAGAYRACLWSRVANRVLLPLAEFAAADDDALYAGTRDINWGAHLEAGRTLAVRCTGQRPAIAHTRFAEQRVKDAIVDQFRARTGARPSVDVRNPDLAVHVHLDHDRASIALDLSGDSLHRRGYREPGTRAPLKENLAAAILLRAGWPEIAAAGGALCDPMTGSGTLAIEAAMIAADIAPAIHRTRFGFLGWRGHDDAIWKALIDEAIERQEAGLARLPPIHAFDKDPPAVRTARANVERAGLAGAIHVQRAELDSVQVPADVKTGLVAVNPPYGERLGDSHELVPLYARLGEVLKTKFPGWRAIVLNGAGLELGLSPERSWQMDNGPIRCRLEAFALAAEPAVVMAPNWPAVDLANRVGKNLKQLRKWLAREAITCYRVYDADIPEYALAVDVYGTEQGDWLHVQEYQPPKSVAPAPARARLRAALNTLPGVLKVKPEHLVFKLRQRQRGRAQYRRQAEDGAFLIVREGAARLYVNLTDYLDTGLFLDHRPVRQWLYDQARGKRFLNLFCYTGAATVQAALGGARATTSVDLSNTYLDWLGRNLELNRQSVGRHKRVRADAREWLARCRETFDLIFLDPPSFSNSKKMETALDIQRDHRDLIRAAMRCLAVSGTLIFSTNLRRFALDSALVEEFDVVDRTGWSIPRDFARSQRIHRCWFIQHRAAVDQVSA